MANYSVANNANYDPIRAYEPKLKRQSTEWRHAGSPKRQKPFPVKLIVIVAYDVRSVIVCNFVPHGRTVTAQYYRDFLVRQVRHGVRDKRPDLVDSAIIQHDNTRPHKAECVRQLLRRRGWEELEHPPIKKPIRGRWFVTREDIANAVRQLMTLFTHGAANIETYGFHHLPYRWKRVVTVAGDNIQDL
ncbi:UNVERIFIED_CONTAM: Histone-lysine N-methyltransferase SETMAR [Trichonephila clavipes]